MKKILTVKGKSQFDSDIDELIRASACGPVTAHVIMHYLFPNKAQYNINELYRLLGGTKIGLFKWRFVRNMHRLLGPDWNVTTCSIEELKHEILSGRPVAAKFDKWFSFRWLNHYEFAYHWVPVIGFEEVNGDTNLIIHDNGSRNQDSQIRLVSYNRNRSVLSFIKIAPTDV